MEEFFGAKRNRLFVFGLIGVLLQIVSILVYYKEFGANLFLHGNTVVEIVAAFLGLTLWAICTNVIERVDNFFVRFLLGTGIFISAILLLGAFFLAFVSITSGLYKTTLYLLGSFFFLLGFDFLDSSNHCVWSGFAKTLGILICGAAIYCSLNGSHYFQNDGKGDWSKSVWYVFTIAQTLACFICLELYYLESKYEWSAILSPFLSVLALLGGVIVHSLFLLLMHFTNTTVYIVANVVLYVVFLVVMIIVWWRLRFEEYYGVSYTEASFAAKKMDFSGWEKKDTPSEKIGEKILERIRVEFLYPYQDQGIDGSIWTDCRLDYEETGRNGGITLSGKYVYRYDSSSTEAYARIRSTLEYEQAKKKAREKAENIIENEIDATDKEVATIWHVNVELELELVPKS